MHINQVLFLISSRSDEELLLVESDAGSGVNNVVSHVHSLAHCITVLAVCVWAELPPEVSANTYTSVDDLLGLR